MDMVERVARAIRDETARNRSAFPDTRDLARAAIEAMREPSEGMVDAASKVVIGHDNSNYAGGPIWLSKSLAPPIWSTMISAALNEPVESR